MFSPNEKLDIRHPNGYHTKRGIKIYFYETANGNSPIKKFIKKLPTGDKARFIEVIKLIEEYGFKSCGVIFKHIEGKLWEIKFKSLNSGFRIFYTMIEKDIMIWLHAFSKKTQKTPGKELDIAKNRLKEVTL